MPRLYCACCGRPLEEADLTLVMDNGPVCRACQALARVRHPGPDPLLGGRQPESPRWRGPGDVFLPPTLEPGAVLSLS